MKNLVYFSIDCSEAWLSFTRAAGQTIYQFKDSLLDDYMRKQLQKPTIFINIA